MPGINAVIEKEPGDAFFRVTSVLRGGQLARRVIPGDILISVDSIPVDGLGGPEVQLQLKSSQYHLWTRRERRVPH
eukprot:3932146-Rhodomonas_salina.1